MFICSTTSNLNNFKPQQLQPQKRVQNEKKKQNRRPGPRKHTKNPTLTLFLHYAPFFEIFWIAPKDAPFICFNILQHSGCQKIAKGPPFYIFRHCDPVRKSHFKKFFCPKILYANFFVLPSIFFPFLQPAGVSQSPKGPPFSILSLRYGADFGRFRLVWPPYGF